MSSDIIPSTHLIIANDKVDLGTVTVASSGDISARTVHAAIFDRNQEANHTGWVVQSGASPGADYPNSIVAVLFAAAQTAIAAGTDYQLYIQVDQGLATQQTHLVRTGITVQDLP